MWWFCSEVFSFLVAFTAAISLLAESMLALAIVTVAVFSLHPTIAVFLAFKQSGDISLDYTRKRIELTILGVKIVHAQKFMLK